ncbi:hypothetical protein IW261DRAFT_1556718 [Armillaria novae-zelandiae]|uniref:Uncharacterized protein n=1 Tax=Armillaria novae-zelandiae TaxID=153914 RepID=A0AA39PVX6_9AGAR|nr:hypothetical protein IW261DRAFT_1556718 [Armillaria novae-zelandiae]
MATENPAPPQRTTDFQLRFPPFPQAPEGVEIVPFKDYKEVGILKETADRVERDALQIPTIALKSPHSKDICKTNAQSGWGDTEESRSIGAEGILEWWNVWEDMERRVHPGGYNDRLPPQARVQDAANDFIRARRKRHPIPQKVNELWDQIQLHLGLLVESTSESVSPQSDSNPNGPSRDDEEDDDVSGTNNNENRNLTFFENPAQSITMFLSYYVINQGWHLDDEKLREIPRLLGFFVKYLIVNNVWPECNASLDRSQSIIDVASQELICTSKFSKALPDDLNYAFRDHWNINPDAFYGDPVPNDDSNTDTPTAEFEQSMKDADLDLIDPEDMEEAIEAEEGGDLGTENEQNADDGAAPASQSPEDDSVEQDWGRPGLMALLGPTALPITHTTGIVEQSMRRIVDVIPPPKDASPLPHAKDPSPEAVEAELERRFTKVVLSPWLGSKTGSDEPTISTLSKGPPHNPWKDNITIFVGENAAKELRVGMGLGGSWIQMARQQDFEIQDDKKKKKKKGKKSDDRFWYMCSLMTVLTSYHLAPSDVENYVPDL